MAKANANKWDSSNWTLGPVTLSEAFGIQRGQIQNPSFAPKLAGAQTTAAVTSQGSSSSSGGPVNTWSQAPANANGTYSYAQLEQIWVAAGGNAAYQSIAAAIAMAESSGNPNSTDYDSNGTVDRGLWQINSIHGSQSTFNILDNARSAVAISNNGTDWSPWTTYTSGAYKQYLQGS